MLGQLPDSSHSTWSSVSEHVIAEASKGYARDFEEIHSRTEVSAHRQPAKMGVIRLLKWLS